jgi:hypothetical protein
MIGVRIHPSTNIEMPTANTQRSALVIVYSLAIRKNMDIGAFWTEFAIALILVS